MEKLGLGVLVALVFAAVIAIGSAIVMFWTALMADLFGYFAPIGYGDSFLLMVLTSAAIAIVNSKATVTKTVG